MYVPLMPHFLVQIIGIFVSARRNWCSATYDMEIPVAHSITWFFVMDCHFSILLCCFWERRRIMV